MVASPFSPTVRADGTHAQHFRLVPRVIRRPLCRSTWLRKSTTLSSISCFIDQRRSYLWLHRGSLLSQGLLIEALPLPGSLRGRGNHSTGKVHLLPIQFKHLGAPHPSALQNAEDGAKPPPSPRRKRGFTSNVTCGRQFGGRPTAQSACPGDCSPKRTERATRNGRRAWSRGPCGGRSTR